MKAISILLLVLLLILPLTAHLEEDVILEILAEEDGEPYFAIYLDKNDEIQIEYFNCTLSEAVEMFVKQVIEPKLRKRIKELKELNQK